LDVRAGGVPSMSAERHETPRILIVEDDGDTRALLGIALRSHGFVVDEAEDAAAALGRMRDRPYDLVVTDYDMPGRTGTQMLCEARETGVLAGAATLVVTAHPSPDGLEHDQRLLPKPIDLAILLRQVDEILNCSSTAPAPKPAPAATGASAIEMVLYVAPGQPSSATAERRMATILGRYESDLVQFEICDVVADPGRAERDGVVFTPTLIKRVPLPCAWLLGDLKDERLVSDLLDAAGVPRRE